MTCHVSTSIYTCIMCTIRTQDDALLLVLPIYTYTDSYDSVDERRKLYKKNAAGTY